MKKIDDVIAFRNYLWSVPCALKDLVARTLPLWSTVVFVVILFSCSCILIFRNSASDHHYACELLIFIIQLVLRLFYCVCQLSIIACMLGCGLPHPVIMNKE